MESNRRLFVHLESKKSTFSPGKSSSSQALASILGGAAAASEPAQKSADKPAFGFKPSDPSPSEEPAKPAEKPVYGFEPFTANESVNSGGFKPPGASNEAEEPKEQSKPAGR
jgi:hypothetical protein